MYLLTFYFFLGLFYLFCSHFFLPPPPRSPWPKKLAIQSVTMTFVNFTASLTCATLAPVSLLSWNLAFSRCSRATTAKKCTKKRDARAKLLFCQSKPIGLLPFSLPSPSSLVKLPNIRQKSHQIVLEELKQRVTAQAAKLRSSEENYTVMEQNKLFECNQKALLGARRNWKNQWYDTRCRRVKKFLGWNLAKRCEAQCRGRTVARSKEWAGWPGKERRGEDFCTDDQKTAKENASLEIPGSRLYAGLLVEKVYSVRWENFNSIKWVPIF